MLEPPERLKLDISFDAFRVLKRVMSVSAIEKLATDVIRLLGQSASADADVSQRDIDTLCQLLCARYPSAAAQKIDALLKAGVTVERICHDYFPHVAHELMARWGTGEVLLDEICHASTRIFLIVEHLRHRMSRPDTLPNPRIAHVVFSDQPPDWGRKSDGDVFRRTGWNITPIQRFDLDQITGAARAADIMLITLPASGKQTGPRLLRVVMATRVAHPDLTILVAGKVASSAPISLAQLGIDLHAETEADLERILATRTSVSDPCP